MKKLLLVIALLVISSCGSVEKTKDEPTPAQTDKKDKTVTISESEIITAYKTGKEIKGYSFQEVADEIVKLYNSEDYRKINIFFNDDMEKALPPEKTEAFCKRVNSECGKMTHEKEGKLIGNEAIVLPVQCEKDRKMNLIVSLNKENRIQGFFIKPAVEPIQFPKITEKTTVADIAKAITSRKRTAGIVIGTYLNGEEKTEAFGYNSIKNKTPVNEDMIFEIGSITKTFTAAILLQLEAEGKLNIDDPVQKYLPENVKMPTFPGDDTQITFRHIASHTSGLPEWPTNLGKYVKDTANPLADYPVEAMYESLNNYELSRKPGEKFEYSSLTMGLLGNILVKIDGKESYEQMIQERIFRPLGMTNSTTKLSKVNRNILAKPHDSGKEVKNWDDMSMAGAGAIKTDAKDMLKYIKALIEKTHPKILPEKMFTEIQLYKKDMYMCFNWMKFHNSDGTKAFGHKGGTGGYTADLLFDKDNKAGVIILTNDREPTADAAKKILQILLKKPSFDPILSEQQLNSYF